MVEHLFGNRDRIIIKTNRPCYKIVALRSNPLPPVHNETRVIFYLYDSDTDSFFERKIYNIKSKKKIGLWIAKMKKDFQFDESEIIELLK